MTPTAAGAGLGLTVIRPAAVEPNRAGSDIFVVRQVIGIRGKLLAVLALPTAVSLVARRRRPAGALRIARADVDRARSRLAGTPWPTASSSPTRWRPSTGADRERVTIGA